jgi:hypothetical protein
LAKAYGIKMWYYWKQLGEPFGNVMGTFLQHIENKKKKKLKNNKNLEHVQNRFGVWFQF